MTFGILAQGDAKPGHVSTAATVTPRSCGLICVCTQLWITLVE